jgi:hypothetical protein
MAHQPSIEEAKLAQERLDRLVAEFRRSRSHSVVLTALCIALSVAFLFSGLPILAFCTLILSCIWLIRYFDVNGHLHEAQRQSAGSLFTHLPLSASQSPIWSEKERGARRS